MKTIRSFTLVRWATLALLAAGFSVGFARAQADAGKFTLPFETHWGVAVLPPGDYTFTLDHTGMNSILLVRRGANNVAFILTLGFEMKSTGRSALTVVRTSTGNTVRDLSLPEIGEVLHYYAPHKPGRAAAPAEPVLTQMIPIVSRTTR